MFNFTGETRKRVVNLGNKRWTDNRNYLEKTRIQRQQREEQRRRENASVVIQTRVRRFLDLLRVYSVWKNEWMLDSYLVYDSPWDYDEDFNAWIIKFLFFWKWGISENNINESYREIFCLCDIIENAMSHGLKISDCLYGLLLKCMDMSLVKLNKISAPLAFECIQLICTCFLRLKAPSNYQHNFSEIKHRLTQTMLKSHLPIEVGDTICLFFASFSIKGSCNLLIRLLCLPQIHQFSSSHTEKFFNAVRNTFINKDHHAVIKDLDNYQKVNMLINFLRIHESNVFEPLDYVVIGSLLSQFSFSIDHSTLNLDNNDADEESEDEDEHPVSIFNSKKTDSTVRVSNEDFNCLQQMYSIKFIKDAFRLLSTNEEFAPVALQMFSTLTFLIPISKSKLCILITVTPGSYKWFYDYIMTHPMYTAIERVLGENHDYVSAEELQSIYKDIPSSIVQNFWRTLLTFEELYSYWLIVSNDSESFNAEKLSLENVGTFLSFLKCLCLTLIFCGGNSGLFVEFQKLRDISISLLNQLYVKNLRMNFVPDSFWKPKELAFNIDNMLQIIIELFEKKINIQKTIVGHFVNGFLSASSQTREIGKLNNDTLSKLQILQEVPFFIDFKERVKVFHALIEIDREKLVGEETFSFLHPPKRLKADIRRESFFEDAFNNFHKCGSDFKHTLNVTLFNEKSGQEAGIDGGGLTKEFLTNVANEGFQPNGKYQLFKETAEDNQLYPNDEIYIKLAKNIDVEQHNQNLRYIQFLGNVVGKCFYENVLIELSFAPFFLSKWCNFNSMKNSINDLNYLDRELYTNLMKLNTMKAEEIEALDLNFTVNEWLGKRSLKFDLLPPNGENVKVDSSNCLNYIHQLSNFRLNQSLHVQTKFFLNGLFEIIPSDLLSMFDPFELQMLISGAENDVNIQNWKENVEYGGYFDDDITVVYFWEVVNEMTSQERFKLIKFVTSVSRAPLLGFGSLSPKFGIRNAGRSTDRLPTASTCVNLLKLPDYQNKELIRSKLLYVINTESTFDLS